jgi:DNA polymerase-3 subunit alpha
MSYTNFNNLNDIIDKKILFLDTETTGIPQNCVKNVAKESSYPDYKSNDYDNSRIIQIGWSHQTNFNYENIVNNTTGVYIKPNNFIINNSDLHGITKDFADENGLESKSIFYIFGETICNSDYIIGYNIYFDIYLLLSEFHKLNMNKYIEKLLKMKEEKKILCIGELSKQYKKYKNFSMPSQKYIFREIFKKNLNGVHNAICDINATIQLTCYFFNYSNKNNNKLFIKKIDKVDNDTDEDEITKLEKELENIGKNKIIIK